MSVVTRPKRLGDTFAPPSAPEATPDTGQTASQGHVRVAEAPERAARSREAPEICRSRSSEAPDAGEGRGSYLEHEFTHGRSQS
jgi:hypothetical protein